MNFQLFIVPSGKINADLDKTIKSFKGLARRITVCRNWTEINLLSPDYDWFGIFYDNESIDEELRSSISGFLRDLEVLDRYIRVQCALVYKKILGCEVVGFSGTLRLFDRAVFIGSNLYPLFREGFLYEECIYGGFIVEHGLYIRPSTDS